MDLNEIENYTNNAIYQRGLSYYENGYIEEVAYLEKDVYEFKIMGRQWYTIRLELDEKKLVNYDCNCPHDAHICKHIIAASLHLKNMNVNSSQKPIAERIDSLLQKITLEELGDFVKNRVLQNNEVRTAFLQNFAHLSTDFSEDFYREELHQALDEYSYRFDEPEYYRAYQYDDESYLEDILMRLFGTTPKKIKAEQIEHLFKIVTVVFQELFHKYEVVELDDDQLFSSINLCLDYLSSINKYADEYLKNQIFQLIWEQLQKDNAEVPDESIVEWAKIAFDLAPQTEQKQQVFNFLEKGAFELYYEGLLQKFIYEMSLELGGDAEAYLQKFIRSNPELRERKVKQLLDEKAFSEAEQLVEEFLSQNKDESLYDRREWVDLAFQLAQHLDKKHKIAQYAKELILFSDAKIEQYYQAWENATPKAKFQSALEQLIQELTTAQYYGLNQSLLYILEKNNRWENYLQHLYERADLKDLENCYGQIPETYQPNLVEDYNKKIYAYLETNQSKEHYQYIAKRIKALYDLGYMLKAKAIRDQLKILYPRHRSLQRELNQLEF